MRFSCLKVTRGSCSSGRNIAPYRANLYASAVLAPGGELVREQSQSQKPVGVGIVASDDERESPMGFLRVERVPLGGDIAAVRICERSPGRRPGSRGDRRCVTRPSMRHVLALA